MRASLVPRLRRWLNAPAEVPLVVELAGDYVAAVRHRHGRVEAWSVRALPEGAVRPAPLAENLANRGLVERTVAEALSAVGDGGRRCALLVPDLLARVLILEFERLPERVEETEALLRWRLSKDMPFDVGQAVLSYQLQPARTGGREVLVAVSPRSLLRQYEECVEALDLQPGWVGLSTLAALGCLGPDSGTPRLLVKRDQGSLGLAVLHGQAVRLFRSVPLSKGSRSLDEGALFDKIYPAVVHFQDQWGLAVTEAVLVGVSGRSLGQRLQQEAGCSVREFDLAALGLPASTVSGAAPDRRLAPALGWIRGETP